MRLHRKPKIAICFFGITRSLSITHHSIRQNAIDPAKRLAEVEILCHFFNQKEIANSRTGEYGRLQEDEYRLLNPDQLALSDPLDLQHDLKFQRIADYGDHWDDDMASLKNLYHQLISLNVVSNLALKSDCDVAVFLRPDLEYHDSFYRHILRAVYLGKRPAVFLPRWQSWGGLNDRFAICRTKRAIKTYGCRLDEALNFCEERKSSLHSESLLKFSLERSGIPVVPFGLRASRVRSTGAYADEAFSTLFQRRMKRLKARISNVFRIF